MKLLLSYFVALLVFLSCHTAIADTRPTSLESEYFMTSTSCYARRVNSNTPLLDDNINRADGYFEAHSARETIECDMPLKHDRDIASVVILVSVNNVELRTCQLIIRYSGSGVNLGYFDVVTDIYGREHFRLDNIGNYPRTSAGHELVGATIICDVGNPIDSERDGYTRFRTIRVDYN